MDKLCCVAVFLSGTKHSKHWHVEVKNDSKSGRPSTSRTEVNVKRVRRVVSGDPRLTFQMIGGQPKMEKQCLEDYHKGFGHVSKVMKLGVLIMRRYWPRRTNIFPLSCSM